MQFPDAFNNDLILQTVRDILAGKKCEIPVYDFKTNSRYMLYVLYNVKGKAIPLQAWTSPEGSRRLRLPDFKTFSK